MKFVKESVVYVDKKVVSRDGKKPLVFAKIADPTTYESEEFIVNDESVATLSELPKGSIVDAYLVVDGRFSSLILTN